MKRFHIYIICTGLICIGLVFFSFLYIYTHNNKIPQTKTIAASADLTITQYPRIHNITPIRPSKDTQGLDVGYNATPKTPIISYIRFDLSSIQQSDPLTAVTYSAKLILLGRYVFPRNTSIDTDYIITAAQIRCDNLYWRETELKAFDCPKHDSDKFTESSILIRGNSIPNFYEWSVTSALEKALEDKQVTFRMTGYALNSNNFNGGVQFWSRDVAAYLGNLYAGPTDVLIVTMESTPSFLLNFIGVVGSIGALFTLIVEIVTRSIPKYTQPN